MTRITAAIQLLILASTVLGMALLYEISPLVPTFVFDFVAFGWALFVVDSILTFVRPVTAYYLGLVLAILGLGASLPQSTHWSFIQNGLLVPSAIFVTGSVMEVLIVVLVTVYALRVRRGTRLESSLVKTPPNP